MAVMDAATTKALWSQAVEKVKQGAKSTNLFRALERTLPVVFEDNTFVVGFQAVDGQMAGVLNTGEYQNFIERTLREVTRNDALSFRVIEGTTYADWEYVKQRDAAALTVRQQQFRKRSSEVATFNTWDEIYDRVSRMWANAEFRNIATGKGRYLASALDLLSEAMDNLYPGEGEKADDQTERALARVVERIASMTASDPAVVAYLLFERRNK